MCSMCRKARTRTAGEEGRAVGALGAAQVARVREGRAHLMRKARVVRLNLTRHATPVVVCCVSRSSDREGHTSRSLVCHYWQHGTCACACACNMCMHMQGWCAPSTRGGRTISTSSRSRMSGISFSTAAHSGLARSRLSAAYSSAFTCTPHVHVRVHVHVHRMCTARAPHKQCMHAACTRHAHGR